MPMTRAAVKAASALDTLNSPGSRVVMPTAPSGVSTVNTAPVTSKRMSRAV